MSLNIVVSDAPVVPFAVTNPRKAELVAAIKDSFTDGKPRRWSLDKDTNLKAARTALTNAAKEYFDGDASKLTVALEGDAGQWILAFVVPQEVREGSTLPPVEEVNVAAQPAAVESVAAIDDPFDSTLATKPSTRSRRRS